MSGAKLLQPTLTAGEVSPSLYGRVDIARYGTGLRRCRNFIVRPYGGVENRPGFQYVDDAGDDGTHRLVPFVFGDGVAYVLVFGHQTVRFSSGGQTVRPPVVPYNGATTYGLDDYVTFGVGTGDDPFDSLHGTRWRSLQANNTGHGPLVSPTWWVQDDGMQLTSPFFASELADLRFTQSADVLYIVHPDRNPRVLRRTAGNVFEFALMEHRQGPFLDLNPDESIKVAASGIQGTVTLTASKDIFVAEQVGNLFYIETKNLGQIKPWVVGDRSIAVGSIRRSDGKTYTAVTVPPGGAWAETGPRQPVHENGRMWDGSGESKTNGTDTWTVGVEWEYTDSGYGIVRLDTFVNAQTMTGSVQKRLPQQVVGGVGGASNTWNLTGDGVTKTFTIAGAGYGLYSVTIGGVGTAPDPNYQPPPPTGGGGFEGGGNRNTQGIQF
jgi:hypothetical protein